MGRLTLLLMVVSWACGLPLQAQMQDRYLDPPAGSGPLRNGYEGASGTLPPLGTNPPTTTSETSDNSAVAPSAPYQPTVQPPAAPVATPAAQPPVSQPLARPAADSQVAERLMSAALRQPGKSRLSGTPVTLEEVISTAVTRGEQSARVNCYWDLCSAVSDYYLSLHEQAELQAVAANTGGTSPVMRGALDKLQRRLDTALTAAKASQSQLASLMGRASATPLPADMPLCVSYEPMFSQNFPGNAPPEAVALNQLLPLRHAELLDAASNVEMSQQFYDQVVQRSGQNLAAGEHEIVKALELMALNRRAFVQIARDYNRRITRYTELAKPGTVGSQRLVAMLIKTDPAATARQNRTASPYGDGRRSEVSPPPTFQEEWTPATPDITPDQGVQPAGYDQPSETGAASHLLPGETSLLGNGAP